MKSIKPGRGPSAVSGIAAIGAAAFGVFWIIMASSIGGGFMAPFGIIFVVLAIVLAVYSFRNATAKNRYSVIDIVDDSEEPDPLNQRHADQKFCAHCGKRLPENANFCPSCGEKILDEKRDSSWA